MGTNVDAATLRQMRDWVADCSWKDLDEGDEQRLTDAEAIAGIQAHYDRGVAGFLRDSQ